MPSKYLIYALITFMASSSVIMLMHSFIDGDQHNVEYMADFGDNESEKEEKKTEERKINNRFVPISLSIKSNHGFIQAMMHTVDFASLYHPEITTPPPEVA